MREQPRQCWIPCRSRPDFYRGSGGEIESMVMGCDRKLKPGGILVMNTITLYTPLLAHQVLEGWDTI